MLIASTMVLSRVNLHDGYWQRYTWHSNEDVGVHIRLYRTRHLL